MAGEALGGILQGGEPASVRLCDEGGASERAFLSAEPKGGGAGGDHLLEDRLEVLGVVMKQHQPETRRTASEAAQQPSRAREADQAGRKFGEMEQENRLIAAVVKRLSAETCKDERAPSGGEHPGMDAGAVRAIIRARRMREQFLGPDLFADPAWDILLDLYAARLEEQRVAVSSLCIAAAVPATTALRWIKTLTEIGLLVRTADPHDGRRVYIELSQTAADGLDAYFASAKRASPLNL